MVQGCLGGQLGPSHAARELAFGLAVGQRIGAIRRWKEAQAARWYSQKSCHVGKKSILDMYIEAVLEAVMV